MEFITSPVNRSRNVVRSDVDGSMGGICRMSDSSCCVASRYADSVVSLDTAGCELVYFRVTLLFDRGFNRRWDVPFTIISCNFEELLI